MAGSVTTVTDYRVHFIVHPKISAIVLSGAVLGVVTVEGSGSIPVGTVVGNVTFDPPHPGTANPVTLGGPGAAKMKLTNNGVVPCDLVTAVEILADEDDDISLSVTP